MRHPAVLSLSCALVSACAAPPAPKPRPPAPAPVTAPVAPAPKVPRVVLVSVDGWRTDLVRLMPTANTLMRYGSWTLKAETPQPAITVVSHAALFTGDTPEHDGVKKFEPSDDKLDAWRPLTAKTVFQILEADGLHTAAIVQKKKFAALVPKGGSTVYGLFSKDGELVDWSCTTIEDSPDIGFIFVHLAAIDAAGHAFGWMSKQQQSAAIKVDGELAALATCMHDSEEKSGTPILLIVTADHGGHGKTHGTTADTDRFVPWIVLGPGIKTDHEIAGPVRLMDTAPTILHVLGRDKLFTGDGAVVQDVFEARSK